MKNEIALTLQTYMPYQVANLGVRMQARTNNPKRIARLARANGIFSPTGEIKEMSQNELQNLYLGLAALKLAGSIEQVVSGLGIEQFDLEVVRAIIASFDRLSPTPWGLNRSTLAWNLAEIGITNSLALLRPEELARRERLDPTTANAQTLGLDTETYLALLRQAQKAREVYKKSGGCYGASSEPTFRIAAEPYPAAEDWKGKLDLLGTDLAEVAKVLHKLPPKLKALIGVDDNYQPPFEFRVDIIPGPTGLQICEIQIGDGALGLMEVEQQMYGLGAPNNQTTSASYAEWLKEAGGSILFLAESLDPKKDPYAADARAFISLLRQVDPKLGVTLAGADDLSKLDPNDYQLVINPDAITTAELLEAGFVPSQLYNGTYPENPLGNKALLASLSDPLYESLWKELLGEARYSRILEFIPRTRVVMDIENVISEFKAGQVVKVFKSINPKILSQGKGVFINRGLSEGAQQAKELEIVRLYRRERSKFIVQEYIESTTEALVLGTSRRGNPRLERLTGASRVCAKFVNDRIGNPVLTAAEFTIYSTVKGNSFMPVQFS